MLVAIRAGRVELGKKSSGFDQQMLPEGNRGEGLGHRDIGGLATGRISYETDPAGKKRRVLSHGHERATQNEHRRSAKNRRMHAPLPHSFTLAPGYPEVCPSAIFYLSGNCRAGITDAQSSTCGQERLLWTHF